MDAQRSSRAQWIRLARWWGIKTDGAAAPGVSTVAGTRSTALLGDGRTRAATGEVQHASGGSRGHRSLFIPSIIQSNPYKFSNWPLLWLCRSRLEWSSIVCVSCQITYCRYPELNCTWLTCLSWMYIKGQNLAAKESDAPNVGIC